MVINKEFILIDVRPGPMICKEYIVESLAIGGLI